MKTFILLFLFTILKPCLAQVVKTKDGVTMGKRADIISSCAKRGDEKTIKINGL